MFKSQESGFSLMELAVVLVLMSLATAMVLPELSKAFTSLQEKNELEMMLLRATGLSSLAFSRGARVVIQTSNDVTRELVPAEGWSIEIIDPIIVNANGFCLGGELKFETEDFVDSVRFFPPSCQLSETAK